mmetsp:Transcript_27146/g.74444  ORF Transcript_27146/g.74444 Transcript_27146/m.74444 type:complete len:126 (+) Transcript_27146:428-805(+)
MVYPSLSDLQALPPTIYGNGVSTPVRTTSTATYDLYPSPSELQALPPTIYRNGVSTLRRDFGIYSLNIHHGVLSGKKLVHLTILSFMLAYALSFSGRVHVLIGRVHVLIRENFGLPKYKCYFWSL